MGIPTLPKREVPEVGYREIRDWVINHLGDELNGEKTTSEIVIELLENAVTYRDDRDMWKARTRMMQEEQADVMEHYFNLFSPLDTEKAHQALRRADELLNKYDPERREKALAKLRSLPSFPDSLLAASGFPDEENKP
jgi:hypothetical protein